MQTFAAASFYAIEVNSGFRNLRGWSEDGLAFSQRSAVRPIAQFPAFQIRFVRVPAGVREAGWHTPLGRVLAVWLDGVVEFETSDGELRRVSAGGFLLVEDTRGKGHISRHPLERQSVILVTLPSGLDLPSR